MSIDKISGVAWTDISKVDGVTASNVSKVNSVETPAALLLDTYTGSSVAYSFRKLNSSYSGYCIRVQNDSAVNLDVGFSGGYLDTAAIASHCGTGNGRITIWYDQSGNGVNATQASVSAMPTIYSSGSLNQVNSKAAASFDGGDLLLSSSTQAHTGSWYATSVVRTPSSVGNQQILCQDDSLTGDRIAQYLRTRGSGTTARTVVFNTTPSNFADDTAAISANTQMQISAYANNSGTFEAFANSSSNGSSSYTGTLNTGSYYLSIGASTRVSLPAAYWTGSMQEIILWDGDQPSNRSSIETEIDTYYSIP